MASITGYIFETNDAGFIIEFSNLGEWSMNKYCSPVRIVRKVDKTVLYENTDLSFLIDPGDPLKSVREFNNDQVILLSLLRQPGPNIWKYPAILINLTKEGFYLVDGVDLEFISLGNKLKVIEKSGGIPSGKKTLDLNSLDWTPLEELRRMK